MAPSSTRKARPRCWTEERELQVYRQGRGLSDYPSNSQRQRQIKPDPAFPCDSHTEAGQGEQSPELTAEAQWGLLSPLQALQSAPVLAGPTRMSWTPPGHPHTPGQRQGCTYGSMLTGVASPITERTGGVTSALSMGQKAGWYTAPYLLQQSPFSLALGGCSTCLRTTVGTDTGSSLEIRHPESWLPVCNTDNCDFTKYVDASTAHTCKKGLLPPIS